MVSLLFSLFFFSSILAQNLPTVGTTESVGKIEGIEIEAKVEGPSAQDTPLQIICLFEYTEGDIYNSPPALPNESNGLVHVDESLKGLLTDIRKSEKYTGKALETLLIDPPKNTILAKKLLLIGLGNRNEFKPEMMYWVGVVGMREALRLEVKSYSHASDLKDAGYDSPTAEVAKNVIKGAISAYQTQKYLKKKKASTTLSVSKVTLLAGQAFFEESKKGIQTALRDEQ